MKLTEVTDKRTMRKFLDASREIYRNDTVWVCPLDSEIEQIFDRKRNAYFGEGEAARWILEQDGRLIGRIAAFYHKRKSYTYEQPTGGIGFFECIDDRAAAFRLFDTGAQWLIERGMKAMDGPVNFGENVDYWGLLVEGFTHPAHGMNYHPPYYRELFESYGFKPFFTQITKHLDLNIPFPDRFWKIAEWSMRRPGYTFRHFSFREMDKFVGDIKEIYDQAWQYHENFSPIDPDNVRKNLEATRSFLVEDFIWFVYHDDRPVAFLVMMPDINQILRRFKGKMTLWNKLRFLILRHSRVITRTRITILGVIPKYQGQGIESILFWHLQKPVLVKRPHIREIEISWVGDYNPKMQAMLEAIGANPGKKHITYRKLFEHKEVEQHFATLPVDAKYRSLDHSSK